MLDWPSEKGGVGVDADMERLTFWITTKKMLHENFEQKQGGL